MNATTVTPLNQGPLYHGGVESRNTALVCIRHLTHREALRLLCREFEENGADTGYNGSVGD
ncbi:MAG: hypothetical protein QM740_19795 [Acidovorax sp.]